MFLGIGSPIPNLSNLPGQGGEVIEVSLDYPSAAVCNDAATQSPSQALPSGGVFSASPSGLNINTSTGVITPTGSTPATYTITYTVSGESSSFTFTINPIQQSTFSYSSSSLEQYGTASPVFASGTTTGGTFSATSGLVINTTTGVLDLASSTIGGPYTVTYTTPGPCATSSTFNVSVTALSTSLVDNNFALSFNGNDEYVSISNSANMQITGAMTISAWVKTTSSNYQSVLIKGTSVSSADYYFRIQDSGLIRFRLGNANYGIGTTSVKDGNWHHICVVYVPSTSVTYYVDGVQDAQTTSSIPAAITNSYSNVEIGGIQNFNGDMDEVAVWNRALELADVQRIYNGSSTSGKAANLFSTGLSNGLVYWNRMGD